MKRILLLLFNVFLISSCLKEVDISNQIIGNWKLTEVKSYGFGGESTIDYSDKNIIYNFKANGILVVSGGDNAGFMNGEYEYFFGEDHLGSNTDPKVLLVKINNLKWAYHLTNKKMTLSQAYVDGASLIFER